MWFWFALQPVLEFWLSWVHLQASPFQLANFPPLWPVGPDVSDITNYAREPPEPRDRRQVCGMWKPGTDHHQCPYNDERRRPWHLRRVLWRAGTKWNRNGKRKQNRNIGDISKEYRNIYLWMLFNLLRFTTLRAARWKILACIIYCSHSGSFPVAAWIVRKGVITIHSLCEILNCSIA